METNNKNYNNNSQLYQVQPALPKSEIILGEKWKPLSLEGYGDYFLISDHGRVYNKQKRKLVKQRPDRRGYLIADLRVNNERKTIRVHRYVLKSFLPIKDDARLQTNHKNGDKNNNKLTNLEWLTPQENRDHAVGLGLYKNAKKFTNEEITLIRETKGKWYKIAQKFGTSAQVISGIKRGLTHKKANDTN